MNLPPASARHLRYKQETPWIIIRRGYGGSLAQPEHGQRLFVKHEPQLQEAGKPHVNVVWVWLFVFFLHFPALCTSGAFAAREANRAGCQGLSQRWLRDSWLRRGLRALKRFFIRAPCKVQLRHSLGCHCLSHTMLLLPVF